MEQLNLFTKTVDDTRQLTNGREIVENNLRDQLNLFHAEPGLKIRAVLDARNLDDIAVEILADTVAEKFYNGNADKNVKLAVACSYKSGSGRCYEDGKPWRSSRSFGRITVAVYDLMHVDEDKSKKAFEEEAAALSSERAKELGFFLDNNGIAYGRYGFYVTHFIGNIMKLGKV